MPETRLPDGWGVAQIGVFSCFRDSTGCPPVLSVLVTEDIQITAPDVAQSSLYKTPKSQVGWKMGSGFIRHRWRKD